MNKPKVAILGVTGMLGSITLDSFVVSEEFSVIATLRDKEKVPKLKIVYPDVEFRILDAEVANEKEIQDAVAGAEWVVNAIGIIKPYIHDDNPKETERAIRVNSLFPELLAKAAKKTDARVLQIATDCVYSGEKGAYKETDLHDAIDVYGKTKSLGETYEENVHHLRCSIIGPEISAHVSLMDWFLGQEQNSSVNGYTNHQWNGVTTLHYARLCQGIIKSNLGLAHIQHIVPGNLISKANLLRAFANEFNRKDITVVDVEAPKVIDRTLSTDNSDVNLRIWQSAGYDSPPTMEEMVKEIASYKIKLTEV